MRDDDPTKRPFHVRTEPGSVFHSGYHGSDQAESAAGSANRAATELGITTRYVVTPLAA